MLDTNTFLDFSVVNLPEIGGRDSNNNCSHSVIGDVTKAIQLTLPR